jgi:hypothetical protein
MLRYLTYEAPLSSGGPWESFRKHARYDGQEIIVADKNATVFVHVGQGKTSGDRPEIDRWICYHQQSLQRGHIEAFSFLSRQQ